MILVYHLSFVHRSHPCLLSFLYLYLALLALVVHTDLQNPYQTQALEFVDVGRLHKDSFPCMAVAACLVEGPCLVGVVGMEALAQNMEGELQLPLIYPYWEKIQDLWIHDGRQSQD